MEHISPSRGVWDGWGHSKQGWGQAGLGTGRAGGTAGRAGSWTGCLGSLWTRQSGPSLSTECMRMTWWFRGSFADCLSDLLLLQGYGKPRRLQPSLQPELSCGLDCRCCSALSPVVWASPASSCLFCYGVGDTCHFSQATLPFSVHSQSCVQMSGTNISTSSSPLLPTALSRHCTHEVTACSQTHSGTEEPSDFSLKCSCCISLQISFLYDHQLLFLLSACLF